MATLNKVMLIGRLTDDPEPPRTLPNSGNTVVKFRFAVGRSKKNASGGWDPDPNPLYIDCEAFSRSDNTKTCDLISQYCRKGSEIFLEGRLQLDNWDDKQTGQKRSKHKVVVDNIQFVGGRNEGEGGASGGYNRNEGGGNFNRGSGSEGGGFNRGGNDRPAMGGGRPSGGAPAGKPAGGGRPSGGYSPPPSDDDEFHGSGGGNGGDGDPIPF